MSDQQPPKIEFPCDYVVKVIGANENDFVSSVKTIFEKHDPHFDDSRVNERPSKGDKWLAVSVLLYATGEDQLRALFEELKTLEQVQLVL